MIFYTVQLVFIGILTMQLISNFVNANVESGTHKLLQCAVNYIDSKNASDSLPFATIAYAQSIDGSIAPTFKRRLHLSSKESFRLLHSLRCYHDSVLVGINTILCDNPQLNIREVLPGIKKPIKQPRSIVLDSNLKILKVSNVRIQRPIIATILQPTDKRFIEALEKLKPLSGDIISVVRSEHGDCDLVDTFKKVKKRFGINSILVEGGAQIFQNVLSLQLVNQIFVTIRPCFIGGYRALVGELPKLVQLDDIKMTSAEGDIILLGKVNMTRVNTVSDINRDDNLLRSNIKFH